MKKIASLLSGLGYIDYLVPKASIHKSQYQYRHCQKSFDKKPY